jgi:hypothetical protein
MTLAMNPINHNRLKYIDVQHHFIRENIENKVIELEYCPSQYMIAYILTKDVAKDRHKLLNDTNGVGVQYHLAK